MEYTYDHQNRLLSRITDPDGTAGPQLPVTEYFVHDGTGQSVTSATLDPNNLREVGQVVLRLDADGDVLNRYLWGPGVDQLLADEQVDSPGVPGDVLWSLTDHLATVRDLVRFDSGANEVETVVHRTYDGFGNVTSESNFEAVEVLFGFTGRLFDQATGLQNNLNRWYDAEVGRWISEDPIGFAGGDANLYRFGQNNSLRYVDPTGLTIGIPSFGDPGPPQLHWLRLPNDPTGLPPEWKRDPSHKDPNGERWRHPNGDCLDYTTKQRGKPGWRGRDHWHHNGSKEHLRPGDHIPDPSPPPPPKPTPILRIPDWLWILIIA